MLKEIRRFKANPEKFKLIKAPKIPDGSPIGSEAPLFRCVSD